MINKLHPVFGDGQENKTKKKECLLDLHKQPLGETPAGSTPSHRKLSIDHY